MLTDDRQWTSSDGTSSRCLLQSKLKMTNTIQKNIGRATRLKQRVNPGVPNGQAVPTPHLAAVVLLFIR